MNILQYRQEIHKNNVAKGFWDKGPNENKGERVMLIVSELGECLEAHRTGNLFDPLTRLRHGMPVPGTEGWAWEIVDTQPEAWLNWFNAEVKNSVQDEMADVVIRILDYCEGFGIQPIGREYRKISTGNFGNDLLRLNHYIIEAYHDEFADEKYRGMSGKDWGYVLSAIESFCQWWNIDIEQHVQWKMRYNATRPQKHGKAY